MQAPDFEEVFGLNAAYAEKVYAEYLTAPDSVPPEWRQWFDTSLPPEQRAAEEAEQEQGEPSEQLTAEEVAALREQAEQQQAMEQWLRRIPDDPGGLLRRKFRNEHQRRGAPENQTETW